MSQQKSILTGQECGRIVDLF